MITDDPNDPNLNTPQIAGHQNKTYLVLSQAERAKGFIRPLRRSYVHYYWLDRRDEPLPTVLTSLHEIGGCGALTAMGLALSETYAHDPKFYGSTWCVGCNYHFPVADFRWDDDGEVVGS